MINNSSQKTFFIDPLDGTMNLALGLGYFSTTLALMKDNQTVFAVVHNPITKQIYWAEKGQGAFLNGKKLEVNQNSEIEKSIAAYICSYEYLLDKIESKMIKELWKLNFKRVITNWSPALDFCLLASGKIEVVVHQTNPLHDFLAGVLIVREAGGKITDFNGKIIEDDRADIFLASNGTKIHNQLINKIK